MKKIIFAFATIILTVCLLGAAPKTFAAANTCTAASAAELHACITQASAANSIINTIAITENIPCSLTSACAFAISNLQKPLLITGTTANAGFTRSSNQTFFNIAHDKSVTIMNLTFSDIGWKPDAYLSKPASLDGCYNTPTPKDDNEKSHLCKLAIYIHDAEKIMIDHISMKNITSTAIQMVSSGTTLPDYTVQNSQFTNIGITGIHTGYYAATLQGGVFKIKNNTFENNNSSALDVFVNSSPANPSIISGNIINHTGFIPMYPSCGYCGTGQLFVYTNVNATNGTSTQNVTIEKNLIEGGVAGKTRGIEMSGPNLKNIHLNSNVIIEDPANVGIMQNEWPHLTSNGQPLYPGVFITNNIYMDNNYFSGTTRPETSIPTETATVTNNHADLTGAQALAKFNELRPPAPPAPTISPSLKSGDFNSDGKVDIFDYNILVEKWGNPYTTTDYNILVGNFGK